MSEPKITITMPRDAAEATQELIRVALEGKTAIYTSHGTDQRGERFTAHLKAAFALKAALEEAER